MLIITFSGNVTNFILLLNKLLTMENKISIFEIMMDRLRELSLVKIVLVLQVLTLKKNQLCCQQNI